jgi:hypothetical protein
VSGGGEHQREFGCRLSPVIARHARNSKGSCRGNRFALFIKARVKALSFLPSIFRSLGLPSSVGISQFDEKSSYIVGVITVPLGQSSRE